MDIYNFPHLFWMFSLVSGMSFISVENEKFSSYCFYVLTIYCMFWLLFSVIPSGLRAFVVTNKLFCFIYFRSSLKAAGIAQTAPVGYVGIWLMIKRILILLADLNVHSASTNVMSQTPSSPRPFCCWIICSFWLLDCFG